MKRQILSILLALSVVSIANADGVPIVIPSGQELYFKFSSSNGGHATVVAPQQPNSSYWEGYARPGGDVIIPDTVLYNGAKYAVRYIREFAFAGCSSITSIVIPNTVESIGKLAFDNCHSLHVLTIGNKVSAIGYYLNNDGSYSGNPDPGILGGNTTTIDTIYYNADSCMGRISNYNIGRRGRATVIIGDNVKYIGESMFSSSNRDSAVIGSVVIGNSVRAIGAQAFSNCTGITSITFRTQNPPTLGSNVFNGINTNSITCNIPCGRTSYYFNRWSNLFNYTEQSVGHSLNVASNCDLWGTASIIQQPSCDGHATINATASCGYYFVRWSDGDSASPRNITIASDTSVTAIFATEASLHDTVFLTNYIHDTTIVDNYIHDTTVQYVDRYVHDTTIVNNYIHDTTIRYVDNYVHDTTIVNSYIYDTIVVDNYVHDTTFIDNYIHDTTVHTIYEHDTIYRDVDTLYITNTVIDTQYTTLYRYIHDTTYITTIVHDTTFVNNTDTVWMGGTHTVYIHDTLYRNVYFHVRDTVIVDHYHDTLVLERTIVDHIHDTAYINLYIHDTTVVTDYVHDTTIIDNYIYDTLTVTNHVHDTAYITTMVYDTLYVDTNTHDTVWLTRTVQEYIHDTVYRTVNHYIHDTTFITNYVHDTAYINRYIHDTTFVHNYIHDTLYLYRYLHDTIYIHDTVYIHGEGISAADVVNAKVYSSRGQVVVEGADGNAVTLYDLSGRTLATRRDEQEPLRFDVPASGAYLIKIGRHAPRKVVVIK